MAAGDGKAKTQAAPARQPAAPAPNPKAAPNAAGGGVTLEDIAAPQAFLQRVRPPPEGWRRRHETSEVSAGPRAPPAGSTEGRWGRALRVSRGRSLQFPCRP